MRSFHCPNNGRPNTFALLCQKREKTIKWGGDDTKLFLSRQPLCLRLEKKKGQTGSLKGQTQRGYFSSIFCYLIGLPWLFFTFKKLKCLGEQYSSKYYIIILLRFIYYKRVENDTSINPHKYTSNFEVFIQTTISSFLVLILIIMMSFSSLAGKLSYWQFNINFHWIDYPRLIDVNSVFYIIGRTPYILKAKEKRS